MKLLLIGIILIGSLAACEKSELMTYQSDNSVYFNNLSSDSALVSLYGANSSGYIDYEVTVNAWGTLSDKDRKISVVTDPALTTAVTNVHYEALKDTFAVKANAVNGKIKIRLLRSSAEPDKEYMLTLKLSRNENFIVKAKAAGLRGTIIPRDHFRIIFALKYYISPTWNTYSYALGNFSTNKVKLLVEKANMDVTRFYKQSSASGGYNSNEYINMCRTVQVYLNEEKAKGNIIRNEDGSVMVMGYYVQ